MADVTKCSNEDCPIKMDCFRHTAQDNNYRQPYSSFKFENNNCTHFYNNKSI